MYALAQTEKLKAQIRADTHRRKSLRRQCARCGVYIPLERRHHARRYCATENCRRARNRDRVNAVRLRQAALVEDCLAMGPAVSNYPLDGSRSVKHAYTREELLALVSPAES